MSEKLGNEKMSEFRKHVLKAKEIELCEEVDFANDVVVGDSDVLSEWKRQSGLYLHYAVLTAKAEAHKGEAKGRLDLCRSLLDEDIRLNSGNYGLEKVNEAAIKEAVIRQDVYVKCSKDLINRTFNANVMDGVLKALEHKKKALERLADYQLSGYHSEPKDTTVKEQESRVGKRKRRAGL